LRRFCSQLFLRRPICSKRYRHFNSSTIIPLIPRRVNCPLHTVLLCLLLSFAGCFAHHPTRSASRKSGAQPTFADQTIVSTYCKSVKIDICSFDLSSSICSISTYAYLSLERVRSPASDGFTAVQTPRVGIVDTALQRRFLPSLRYSIARRWVRFGTKNVVPIGRVSLSRTTCVGCQELGRVPPPGPTTFRN
jgi:hypothetical protein